MCYVHTQNSQYFYAIWAGPACNRPLKIIVVQCESVLSMYAIWFCFVYHNSAYCQSLDWNGNLLILSLIRALILLTCVSILRLICLLSMIISIH